MAKDAPSGPDPHYDYKHEILKNLPGFTDPIQLDNFERVSAAEEIFDLQKNPVNGAFNSAHLKAIHARIFQRVYPWAGEFRQVNLHRAGSYYFAVVQFMEENLNSTFAKLAAEKHLKGLDAAAFASRAAFYLGELNAIHPFREGNGRTPREFIRQLAAEAGFRINWSRVTRQQMYEASIESHSLGNNTAFAALILAAIEPTRLP
ncbi:MAG: Fic family protein [Terracidiphilus sp.]|jgi:cell filamentation protein